LIKIVVDFKDELIILAGVIGAVFVVSKIAAGVAATIAAIKTLVNAYNALKASAIVAGVATAFALNPLLGVGAVALAAGVLAGANALARSSDVSGADAFATTGTPGAISGGGRSTGSTTVSGGGGGGVGGGGGGVATAVATAATATKAITGAFTDSQNAARLAAQGGGGFTDSQNAARLVTINVNAPSIIDEEGFSRAATNALNNSTFRGTNGAANLVYL
jgi:hypothetical protein